MSLRTLFNTKKPPFFSFELFPARDEKSARRQDKAIDSLLTLKPDFMSVTFGAGGSTREGSYDLVKRLMGLTAGNPEIVAYVAAYGLNPAVVRDVIQAYIDIGVQTIFCIRGDRPHADEFFHPHPAAFPYAADLLLDVHAHFDLCTGAAGYPEGHKEAVSLEEDLAAVRRKVAAGAEFIISQYCYDNQWFFNFVKSCRQIGITVPILAGIMPIYSESMTENLARTCGASITPDLRDGLAGLDADNNDAVSAFGIEFLIPKCRELLENGVDGLHFYTMNKSKSVAAILDAIR
ncbi:methylenetetrahydrofolate reductase [bacterium]|nr:methylenetetrahydrofolate reductase [candidate division CSSED10-310 bacterium]